MLYYKDRGHVYQLTGQDKFERV